MSDVERAIEKKEYIERGAFLNWLNKRMDEVGTDKESRFYVNQTMTILESYPAADVEPVVRGEWIEHYDECECPVCGETWNYCDNDTERFDCCPKCGARLVEHGKERER